MRTILLKTILVLIFALGLHTSVKAQLVYIPNANFRSWIRINCPGCMVGDSLDTTCPAVLNKKYIDVSNKSINDLTGIEYFINDTLLDCSHNNIYILAPLPGALRKLNCSNNEISILPNLPDSLVHLDCQGNELTSLPTLPNTLTYLDCNFNKITSIPTLPSILQYLDCYLNKLTSLPPLSSSLQYLNCRHNDITSIPTISSNLEYFDCSENQITSLPALPNTIDTLICNRNLLSVLPSLPTSLQYLWCAENNLMSLPSLPSKLKYFNCGQNFINNMPSLPDSLRYLYIAENLIPSLPTLPKELRRFNCGHNRITNMPWLPNKLRHLECYDNKITHFNNNVLPKYLEEFWCDKNLIVSLPILNTYLKSLGCSFNQITYLPKLPPYLQYLYCNDNPLTCFTNLVNVHSINFANTLISCLPNNATIAIQYPSISTYPICNMYNSNGCDSYMNFKGKNYVDADTNCVYNVAEKVVPNHKINLYKNGILNQQTYTDLKGDYFFDTKINDNYKVEFDTTESIFDIICPSSNFYLDTITATDSLKYGRDFALKCKGIDIAASSIYALNFRPASLRTVKVLAGDFTNNNGFNCSAGASGTVTITITGACNYVSSPNYALTPTTAIGNVLTYSIADFGAISYDSTFDFNLLSDTSAVLGSQICITVNVTTSSLELNYNNNLVTYCFTVVGSCDPNDKAVYPENLMDVNGDRWLTYTIRFQNTGTADAEDIFITDTLSADLMQSTFTLLSYSHMPIIQMYNNRILKFNFPNIHLPDSNTNEPESHGFVQYKIRAKDNLTIGDRIENTANIYFDFNAPVITNTTSNIILDCTLLQPTITQSGGTLVTPFVNVKYQWIDCSTGTPIAGATNQTFSPTQNGSYAVIVDFGSCIVTSDCFNTVGVGINEINASNISIQPNPFNNELKITMDKNYEGVIEVYNTLGAIIFSEKLQSKNLTLNTSNWNAGVYILKVATNDGVVVKKVVKR